MEDLLDSFVSLMVIFQAKKYVIIVFITKNMNFLTFRMQRASEILSSSSKEYSSNTTSSSGISPVL